MKYRRSVAISYDVWNYFEKELKNGIISLVEILDEKLIPESGMRHAVCRNRALTLKEL